MLHIILSIFPRASFVGISTWPFPHIKHEWGTGCRVWGMIAGIQKSATGGPLMRQGLPLCLINPLAFQECARHCVCVCQSGKFMKGEWAFPPPFHFRARHVWATTDQRKKKALRIREELLHFGDIFLMFLDIYRHKRHDSHWPFIKRQPERGVKKQISQMKSNEESEKLIWAPPWFLHRQTSIMWRLSLLTLEIKVAEGRGRWELRVSEGVVVISHSH